MAWQQASEERDRPALKGLRHECVVGIRKNSVRHLPGLVPIQLMLVNQEAHQFGDGDRGMRVIELHGELLGKLIPSRTSLLAKEAEHVLQGAGSKEILLLEAQLFALRRVIIWI